MPWISPHMAPTLFTQLENMYVCMCYILNLCLCVSLQGSAVSPTQSSHQVKQIAGSATVTLGIMAWPHTINMHVRSSSHQKLIIKLYCFDTTLWCYVGVLGRFHVHQHNPHQQQTHLHNSSRSYKTITVATDVYASLIDWISDTLSQGYTHLQSLVKCLDHRGIASITVCSQATCWPWRLC